MNDYVLLKSLVLISIFLIAGVAVPGPKKKSKSYTPLTISLLESSGAIAPEFRYALDIKIERTSRSIFLYRKKIKDGKQIENRKKRITESKFNQIYKSLLLAGADKFKREELPEQKLLGVSYNEFLLKTENKESHFYYLIKDLEKKNFKNKKDIIQIMKRLHP